LVKGIAYITLPFPEVVPDEIGFVVPDEIVEDYEIKL